MHLLCEEKRCRKIDIVWGGEGEGNKGRKILGKMKIWEKYYNLKPKHRLGNRKYSFNFLTCKVSSSVIIPVSEGHCENQMSWRVWRV